MSKRGWKSIDDDELPEYHELIWCSDGVGIALGTMTGISYFPPKYIFKNKERGGCDELFGIKFWKKCIKPKI